MRINRMQIGCLLLFAIGISCDELLFVDDISGEKITVLAPSDKTELVEGDVIFSWETNELVEAYQLQLAIPDFENASQILLDTIITARSFTKALVSNSYEWRLRGVNSQYETGYTTQSFVVSEAVDE